MDLVNYRRSVQRSIRIVEDYPEGLIFLNKVYDSLKCLINNNPFADTYHVEIHLTDEERVDQNLMHFLRYKLLKNNLKFGLVGGTEQCPVYFLTIYF